MANQLYGYNPSNYSGAGGEAAASNSYTSRSVAELYLSGDTALRGSAYRFLSADSLSAAKISTSFLYNPDSYSSRIPGASIATSAHSYAPPGVDVGCGIGAATESIYDRMKRTASESLYHRTILGAHNNTIGQNEAWYSTNLLSKRPKYENTSHMPVYPQRPGEKDCVYYMQKRICKFGDSCRFDHPIWVPEGGIPDWKEVPPLPSESLPERPGEPDCPYFLKTQKCKYGIGCRFNHPKQKTGPLIAPQDGDVSVLPERPSEPPCAFYMKTGNCKFGSTCKFHHPKDVQIQSAGEEITKAFEDATPLFTQALLHNTKGLPIRPDEEDCPFYLKMGSCKYGATCRYSHPERYVMKSLAVAAATAPAFLTSPSTHFNIGITPTDSFLPSFDTRLTQTTLGLGPSFYPQRPGQQDCDFYMKTGVCKFGDACKFHHPFDRSTHTASSTASIQQNVKLTLAGLPRREGAINCPYYMKTGTCKYGSTCKFDHPPPAEVLATAESQVASAPVNGDEERENGGKFK